MHLLLCLLLRYVVAACRGPIYVPCSVFPATPPIFSALLMLSHPSICVTIAAGRVSNAFLHHTSWAHAHRILCQMCHHLMSLCHCLFSHWCQILLHICLRLNVLATWHSGTGKLVMQRQ